MPRQHLAETPNLIRFVTDDWLFAGNRPYFTRSANPKINILLNQKIEKQQPNNQNN